MSNPSPGAEAAAQFATWHKKWSAITSNLQSITDEDVNIATTPKQLVFSNGKMRLYRYDPPPLAELTGNSNNTTTVRSRPLLIVYSLIGRYSMIDLQPDRSIVRQLLAQGLDVYVIDWGNPRRTDRWLRFDDYVENFVASAVDFIRESHRIDSLSMLGICEGGVFATCYAALHPEHICRLALAVTPIDFHADSVERVDHGYINRWARNLSEDEITRIVDSYGHMPGEVTGMMFEEMTPVKSLTRHTWDLQDALSGDREQVLNFLRMEKWLSDRPHHPGEAAKQWMGELYHGNKLVNGRFKLDGKVVQLASLTMPILNIYATNDHIVPAPTSRALENHCGSVDYRELALPAGHIGAFVSKHASGQFGETLAEWALAATPS